MEIRNLNNKVLCLRNKKIAIFFEPDGKTMDDSKEPVKMAVYPRAVSAGDTYNKNYLCLFGPGEYEVGGVEVVGYKVGTTTIYSFLIDGIVCCYIPGLTEALTEKKLDKLSSVDVLLYSLDSDNRLSSKDIVGLAKRIGANVVVPTNFDLDNPVFRQLMDDVDKEDEEYKELYKVEKDDLPDGLEVVVLWKM